MKWKNAVGDDQVEKVISHSIERFPKNDLLRFIVIIYLRLLQSEFQNLSEQNVDLAGKRNVGMP